LNDLLERLQNNRNALGLLFMLPAAVLLLLFLTYPLGLGFWLGFTDAKVGRPGEWIGLENYEFLWGDASPGWPSSTPSSIPSSPASSSSRSASGSRAAQPQHPLQDLLRAVILLPYIVPTALSAIAFWWIYDAQFSIISWMLVKLGLIDKYIDFLGDPWNARLAVIAANIWRGVPFVAITLLAGLQTISPFVLRGVGDRRRVALAAVPPRHPAAAHADHRRRDDVLGALHLHRLPAHLRHHARRARSTPPT
jgi:multiple sugar transport system permease protein